MRNLQELEQKYGSVEFEGKKYILTDEAVTTGRQLNSALNYNGVEEGEMFEFEMSARAISPEDNKEYIVYWVFQDIKGEDGEEDLSNFNYDDVDRVELA